MSWVEKIKKEFDFLNVRESAPGEWEFTINKEQHLHVLNALKDLEGGGFNHLSDLTAYDEFPQTPRYSVVYNLTSMERRARCSVHVPLNDDKPELQTVLELWPGANWLEREVFDMFGIHFIGHPDERRILMPQAFKGHPLQKDFVVDYRQEFAKSDLGDSFDPFGSTVVSPEKRPREKEV